MDFAHTAEEEALVGSLRETLQQCCAPAHLRAWEEAGASCDAAFVEALAGGGFLEVGLPWGPAPGLVPLALLAEESGRFLAPPLLSVAAGYAAFALGEHPLARRLAAGQVCAVPPPGRFRATLQPGGGPGRPGTPQGGPRLSGHADGVALLDRADWILLEVDLPAGGGGGAGGAWGGGAGGAGAGGAAAAGGPEQRALACLRPSSPGVAAEAVPTQSGSPLWRLRIEGAAPEELVAVPAERLAAAADRWRICVAAWSVGAGARAVELAVAHASARRQFGHPVGSYQSVQNRLVDAAVLLEEARMLTSRVAVLLDGGAAPAGARPGAGTAVGAGTGAGAGTGTGTGAGSGAGGGAGTGSGPGSGPGAGPGIGSGPGAGPGAGPDAGPGPGAPATAAAGVLPRLARRLAGQAFQQAARAATLTFGGYGFIVDSDIQLFYRRGKDEQLRFEPPALRSAADLPLPRFHAAEAGKVQAGG